MGEHLAWLQGFALIDLGMFVCYIFICRIIGKPLPFEAQVRRVLEWARAHRWI